MTDCEKRAKLLMQYEALKAEREKKLDAIADDDTISDEEYDSMVASVFAEYDAKMDPIWLNANALAYPLRRGWFADVFAPSFGLCENKQLSRKQTEVFRMYCVSDENTWRSGETFCRFADKFVKLAIPKYSKGIGYVTIRQL